MGHFWKASLLAVGLLAFASKQAWAETDLAASGYAAFTSSTTASNVVQHPASQGGYLIELRHIRNPIEGFKINYGFNRANEVYSTTGTCTVNCTSRTTAVSADAHELTAE